MSPPQELTPQCEQLDEYLDDELSERAALDYRYHLAGCNACQLRLHERMQLIACVEELRVNEVHIAPRPLPPPWRRPAYLAGAGLAVAAAALLLFLPRPPAPAPDPVEAWMAARGTRPVEAWLGSGALGHHRPFTATMGSTAARSIPPTVVAALEERHDWLAAATLRAWDGDFSGADRLLERIPPGNPDAQSLHATVVAALGRPERALNILDDTIGSNPSHQPARWNRALVLADLGLELLAAEDFDAVAQSGAAGWSGEASSRAEVLRTELRSRFASYRDVLEAAERMMRQGTPMPARVVRAERGTTRHFFYHALAAASTRERVLALGPVAAQLDELGGGQPVLRPLVDRVAGSRFDLRRPLAEHYLAAYDYKYPDKKLLDEARARARKYPREPRDILIGALALGPDGDRELAEFEQLAEGSGDPWWAAWAAWKRANRLIREARFPEAKVGVQRALVRCHEAHVDYRCAHLENQLVDIDRRMRQPVEALRRVRTSLEWSRRSGMWSGETFILEELASVAHSHPGSRLSSTVLDELALRRAMESAELARRPLSAESRHHEARKSCGVTRFRHEQAAVLDLERLDAPSALRHLQAAPGCEDERPSLTTAELLSSAALIKPDVKVKQRALDILAARRANLAIGEDVVLQAVAARLELDDDRAASEVDARAAIEKARTIRVHPSDVRDALSDAWSLLIQSAAANGDWAGAWSRFAEEIHIAPPSRCAIGLSAEMDRLALVMRDARGALSGRIERGFDGALTTERLAGWGAFERLAGCEVVDVIARPPLLGRSVLPPEMAWRYRGAERTPQTTPPPAPRSLIVSGVKPPDSADLAPLPAWPSALGTATTGAAMTALLGVGATPTRILDEMENATEILFHAHGIVDSEVSEVSYLAVSPDGDGRYTLTAREIRALTLAGRPVVFLAACRAAEPGPFRREPWSLPEAFLQAGATAVLAATSDLDSHEAEPFFDEIRRSVRAGLSPAVALRDARKHAIDVNPATTLRDVLLFQ